MFLHLCSVLIITLCGQHVASRHIADQSFYPSYPDYSYMYSGLGPYHQLHSPFYTPPGTYFDQRQGILRPFPGGGVPILVDHHKRCADNFIGLKADPHQHQYYYVCKPNCVIFGKCQNLQIFNATSSQCVQHPPPEYIPTCTGLGRFPLYSDCHLYFKCEEDLKPKIYSCPFSMVFSPSSKKCIKGDKCTLTQISPHSSYIPEMCANKFPPCYENGTFRSPSDCSLYYKCDLKKDGFYMQTRSKCEQGKFYDLQRKTCLPAKEVPCDCIQVAELVYPKPHNSPYEPPVYPAHFDLDSIVDSHYPVEETNEGVTESSDNCNEHTSETMAAATETTTSTPSDVDDELTEKNPSEMEIFSQFIDKSEESEEDEELTLVTRETFATSEEGSGFETDTKEPATEQTSTVIENNSTIATTTTATTEAITELGTTFNTETFNAETTSESSTTTEKEEISSQTTEETTTTSIPKEIETIEDEEDSQVGDTLPLLEPEACNNLIIENEGTSDADTQAQDPSQTQNRICLTKHTPISSNTVTTESMKTTEQNSTTLTSTPPIPTTKIRDSSLATFAEKNTSEENNLDSVIGLDRDATTQASEKSLPDIEQTTQQPEADFDIEDPMTTLHHTMQTTRTRSITTSSLEEDFSYEDLLESEITKKTKAEFIEPKLNSIFQSEQTVTEEPIAWSSAEATTIKPSTATTSENIRFEATVEQSTDMPLSDEEEESDLLDSEIKIDNSESSTEPQEDFIGNLLKNEELLPLAESPTGAFRSSRQKSSFPNKKSKIFKQPDFSDEDFIPVRSQMSALNEIEQENSIFSKDFDDDYTTVMAEQEITTTTTATTAATTTLASTIPNINEENNEITLFDKVTTLKRRQTSRNETEQTTTTTTQISVTTEASTHVREPLKDHNAKEKDSPDDKESHENGVLDSKIIVTGQDHEAEVKEVGVEVSHNEITSAETIQTTTNSAQQNKPLSHSTATTPTSQNSTTTNTTDNSATFQPNAKQTDSFILHLRKEDPENSSTRDSSPSRKSLYYILKTKPVINKNDSKTDHELVTATQEADSDSGEIPRLKIIAERPIDIQFSICPSTCNKDHKLNPAMTGRPAVFLKWFARKSKQTLGFETANETNMDKED